MTWLLSVSLLHQTCWLLPSVPFLPRMQRSEPRHTRQCFTTLIKENCLFFLSFFSSYRVWLFQRPQASPREEKRVFASFCSVTSLESGWDKTGGCKSANDGTEADIRVSDGQIGTWRRTRAFWMGELLLVVWPQLVERTKCSQSCVRPCDPFAGHAPSLGSASHFNPVTHF